MQISVTVDFDRYLMSRIIGRGGEGTRAVLRALGNLGLGRGYIKCEILDGSGVATLTADESSIDVLRQLFIEHVKGLTKVFYVRVCEEIAGLFKSAEMFHYLRGYTGGRYISIKCLPIPHTRIYELECKCLVEDFVDLMYGVTDTVEDLHQRYGVSIPKYVSNALPFVAPKLPPPPRSCLGSVSGWM